MNTKKKITRREFLKISACASLAAGLSPYFNFKHTALAKANLQGRITRDISVFDKPNANATTIDYIFRDDIFNIIEEITALHGPAFNPVWYRIESGFIHSSFVQAFVEKINTPKELINEIGELAELSVAYVEPYTYSENYGWAPIENSRIYYESTHWIVETIEGPDKTLWYRLESDLNQKKYYAPAYAFSILSEKDLAPIHPEIPKEEKHIYISLRWQMLQAFEGKQEVLRTLISSGIPSVSTNGIPTETPTGEFYVQSKQPSKHMGSGALVNANSNEDLPGVPWTMFFDPLGYAIHGTYWHNNFGWQMSKGCVNMHNKDAKWLFRWASPDLSMNERYSKTLGTKITIR